MIPTLFWKLFLWSMVFHLVIKYFSKVSSLNKAKLPGSLKLRKVDITKVQKDFRIKKICSKPYFKISILTNFIVATCSKM
ncbi:unnamed protein product [Rhizophagus irregularis]|nr:unnamed protein product [Rhizophagus irregularis]